MTRFKRLSLALTACAALFSMHAPAAAQSWPAKQVRIIVPSAPGDGSDIAARLIGEKLSASLGQPFIIENITGAGGVLGTQAAAKAPADGYTLIMGNAGSHGINAAIFQKLSYDPIADFMPISMIFRAPNIFVAAPNLGVKSLAELIALAKSRADPLNYASGGNGSSAHLNAEYLKLLAKFDAKHVPYRGASPALNDIIPGHVHFMSVNLPPALQLVKTGKITPLAVTSATRSKELPDVPTVAESGFPGYETLAWFGLLAPKGTTAEIITTLHNAIVKACADTDVQTKLVALGGDVVCNAPADFGRHLTTDVARWKQVATDAKIRLEQ